MVTQTAVFRAVADFKGLLGQSKQAERALGGVEGAAGNAFGAKIGKSMGERGRQMSQFGKTASLATAPVALMGGAAVNTFAKFETSITQAGVKAGATRAELKEMTDVALELGAKTKFSATESATAMDALAAGGMNARQSIETLPAVMLAAQAANEDLGLTAAVTSQAMNAFNIQSKDATHVADLFAVAASTTALDMNGLADALANAGEVGPRFNQSLEDVLAVTGRLRDMGVPAASAGVAIRQSLTALAKPSTKAATLLEDLGIKTTDATGQMLPLPQLLKNVKNGLDANSPAMKTYAQTVGMSDSALKDWAKSNGVTISQAREIRDAMTKGGTAMDNYAMGTLFGVEGAKAFALAMSDGKPLILDAQKDVEKMDQLQRGLAETMGAKGAKAWIAARTEQGKFTASGEDVVQALSAIYKESDGAGKKAAKAFDKTLSQKIDNFTGSLESMSIVFVQKMKPALVDILEWLTKAAEKTTEWMDKNPEAARTIGLIVGAILLLGPTLWIFGKIASGIGGIISAASGGVGKVKAFAGWVKDVGGGKNKTGRALDTMRLRMAQLGAATKAGLVHAKAWLVTTVKQAAAAARTAAAWALQKARLVALWVWQKTIMLATKAWAAAQWLLNVALNANPIGIVIGLLVLLAAGLYLLWTRSDTFRGAVKRLWAMCKTAFAAIGAAGVWLWKKVLVPAFKGIGAAAKWLWDKAIRPAFSAMNRFIRNTLGPVFRWIWQKVVRPAFTGIGNAAKWAWENVIQPALSRLKSGVRSLGGVFSGAVSAIRKAWDKIKGVVKAPVRFVIETVFNKGLIKGVNWLLRKVGAGKSALPEIGLPKGFRTGGYTGAMGKNDVAGVVHGDEHVIRSESRRRMEREYPGLLDHMNRWGTMQGYKKGGRVWPLKRPFAIGKGYPGHTGIDLQRADGAAVYAAHAGRVTSTPSLTTSYGKHIRIAGTDGVETIYAHLARIAAKVGQAVKAGQQIGITGRTGNTQGGHLHFEARPPGGQSGSLGYLQGAATPTGKSIPEKVGDLLGGLNPVKWLGDKINSLSSKLDKFSGPVGDAVRGVFGMVGRKAKGWAKGMGGKALATFAKNPFSAVFDSGGVLPTGTNVVHNLSGKPEAVLTNDQWSLLLRQTEAAEAMRNLPGSPVNRRPYLGDGDPRVSAAGGNSYIWNVFNPVAEKTSATTLRTLVNKAHGGLNG